MAKKKKLVINLELPKEFFAELNGVPFIKQKERLFFQSRMNGKIPKCNDGLIVQNKKMHGLCVGLGKDDFRSTYQMTVKQLKALTKYVERREEYFKAQAKKKKNPALSDCFFVHFSPDLSILFTDK